MASERCDRCPVDAIGQLFGHKLCRAHLMWAYRKAVRWLYE